MLELKTNDDLKVTQVTFYHYSTKGLIEVNATIQRLDKDNKNLSPFLPYLCEKDIFEDVSLDVVDTLVFHGGGWKPLTVEREKNKRIGLGDSLIVCFGPLEIA